jgi:hypothetical protein
VKLAEISTDPDLPRVVRGKGFIDQVQIHRAAHSRYGLEILVRREYERVASVIDAAVQLPAWLRFRAAQRGMQE